MAELLEGDYRGNAMLIIRQTPQDKFPFQFGLKKGRLIVDHYEQIKTWVEKEEKRNRANAAA